MITIFLRPDATATIYFAAHFVRLLFEGGVYFAQELQIVWLLFEGQITVAHFRSGAIYKN